MLLRGILDSTDTQDTGISLLAGARMKPGRYGLQEHRESGVQLTCSSSAFLSTIGLNTSGAEVSEEILRQLSIGYN